MLKKLTMLTALFAFLLVPMTAFAGGGGGNGESAANDPTGLTYWVLVLLSIVSLVYFVFLMLRDNG
ncbi:hypothetical protein [Bacillus alkalicellulosilyticus]|uniref:hypothetical protein n=1 Tax=Alkalihalobacterium alkalicellulosilyticum TaxID=1912214 RepID=UPI000997D357|nr:hypothetical protein [Bacillus alkalicellulosilyticus]